MKELLKILKFELSKGFYIKNYKKIPYHIQIFVDYSGNIHYTIWKNYFTTYTYNSEIEVMDFLKFEFKEILRKEKINKLLNETN